MPGPIEDASTSIPPPGADIYCAITAHELHDSEVYWHEASLSELVSPAVFWFDSFEAYRSYLVSPGGPPLYTGIRLDGAILCPSWYEAARNDLVSPNPPTSSQPSVPAPQ